MGKIKIKTEGTEETQTVPRIMDLKYTPLDFQKLPNELVEKILLKLHIKDKRTARLLDSRCYAALEKHCRYSIPIQNDTLHEFKIRSFKMNEVRVPINKLIIPTRFIPSAKKSLESAKTLHILADEFYNEDGTCLKHTRNGGIDGEGIQYILRTCKNIETLRFDTKRMGTFGMVSELNSRRIKLEFLTTLQVLLTPLSPPAVVGFLFNLATPSLRRVDVEHGPDAIAHHITEIINSQLEIYTDMLKCWLRNKTTLRSLRIIRYLPVRRLGASYLSGEEILELFNRAGEVQLEDLELQHMKEDPSCSWLPAQALISNQKSLKSFKLHTDSTIMLDFLENLFPDNSATLTTLVLHLTNELQFDTERFATLTSLTRLSFTSDYHEFGFFPPTLKHLTWNCSRDSRWTLSKSRLLFPNLITIEVGTKMSSLPDCMSIRAFCGVLFGTEDETTKLEQMVVHLPEKREMLCPKAKSSCPIHAAHSKYCTIFNSAQHLCKKKYRMEVENDVIYISRNT